MEQSLSRSEQKRRIKSLEDLATELVALPPADIRRLPCDDSLKVEIQKTKAMKAGSRKRQLKYLAKQIRQAEFEPLYTFLAEHKGSKLQRDKVFHELEQMRDTIISEAITANREAEANNGRLDSDWASETVRYIALQFPGVDATAIKSAAISYTRSHNPTFSREIFRLLKAGKDLKQFSDQ